MHSPFTTRSGRIHYAPHHVYRLPHLRQVGSARLARVGDSPARDVPRYELRWPGREVQAQHLRNTLSDVTPADIPIEITNRWLDENVPTDARFVEDGPSRVRIVPAQSPYTLKVLVCEDKLPEHPPLCVAYHLAVNSFLYYADSESMHPVAALPPRTVAAILQTPFAIDAKHRAALTYLKWLAESHAPHPLLSDFDTVIRESLLGIRIEAERCFFMLLQDCIYDEQAKWFARDERDGWQQLAHYLFLCGRAGDVAAQMAAELPALIDRWAAREAELQAQRAREPGPRHRKRTNEEMRPEREFRFSSFVGYRPAVLEQLERWRRSGRRLAQQSSYTAAAWREMPPEYKGSMATADTKTPNSDS